MKIATLLFTYNRSWHTEQVLEALSQNYELPEKLFVFQDGIKRNNDTEEWNKVNKLIKDIDWCDKEVIVSKYNKGLADSIVSGINYVFERYDAVIVLEDDCVPRKNFMSFMNQCFEKYQNDKTIYSITGYSWPIMLRQGKYDIYGCGRISSWGWGTWKDRWNVYEKNYESICKMKQEEIMSRNLALWGMDLEDILVGNVRGNCNSWAVFWALNVISRGGVCINPYKSLIKNIGMDGTGVHCGTTNRFDVECIDEEKERFFLPDTVSILKETECAFAPFFGSYTAVNDGNDKMKILVYGAGYFYMQNEGKINRDYYIEKFIDQKKTGYLAGKEIIRPKEIKDAVFEKIIIMIRDNKESNDVFQSLVKKYYISEEKIEIGSIKYQT